MRLLACLVAAVSVGVACGGATTGGIDGGSGGHAGSGGHSGSAGSSGSGGAAGSAGTGGSAGADGSAGTGGSAGVGGSGGSAGAPIDAGSCKPLTTACEHPCPSGTYCLIANGPGPSRQLGCAPIPDACHGTATCECMAPCFCTGSAESCMAIGGALECNSAAISRREFKKDIAYVTTDERAELANEALTTSLATYRYKAEPDGHKKHLGFIIDDQPGSSPAVAGDGTHVDEYGYASMLLAAIQEQQKQIEELKKELAEVKVCRVR